MAVRTFYGKCDTGADTSAKVVVIESETITPGFQFNIGDLLVVYFADTNTEEYPTIVIHNADTEQEVSISGNKGKYIKTRSVNVDAVGAWEAGETVIFAYTKNNNRDVDNAAYWELINSAPSTETVYGVTKLDGNEGTNISEWLNTPGDFTRALTSGMLKKFYQTLIGSSEPGPEPEPSPIAPLLKLYWSPAEAGAEKDLLGVLSVNNDEKQGVEITFPLEEYIKNLGMIKNTSDLHNDGHAEGDYDVDASARDVIKTIDSVSTVQWDMSNFNVNYLVKVQLKEVGTDEYVDYNDYTFDSSTKIIRFNAPRKVEDMLRITYIPIGEPKVNGEFYITNVLPKGRSLYYSVSTADPTLTYEFLKPCDENNNLLVNSAGAIKLNGTSETIISKGLIVKGNTDESVGPITSGAINCGPITSGAINADNNTIQTTGKISGGTVWGNTLYEGEKSLTKKYSRILKVEHIYGGKLSVKANSNSGHQYKSVELSGWKPLGIVGYNINYKDKDKGDATWCGLWECHLLTHDNKKSVEYSIRNYKNKKITVEVVFDILYVENA